MRFVCVARLIADANHGKHLQDVIISLSTDELHGDALFVGIITINEHTVWLLQNSTLGALQESKVYMLKGNNKSQEMLKAALK